MSQRVVIRLAELASFPAQEAQPAQPAIAGKRGKKGKRARLAKAARPAKRGKLPASPATIWRWVREGKFPKPFKLGSGITVWDEAEVDAFIASRADEGLS
jgi:prophage regulatory protein